MKKKHILTLVYAICGLLCLAVCLWAENVAFWAKNMVYQEWNINYDWLQMAALAALGIVWGGEHCLAKQADKKVVAAVRILQIAALLKWSAWWWEPLFPADFPLPNISAAAIWLLLGLQLFSTVELLVKKPKSA